MSGVRVRFAPSPTGKFHVGLARTALFNFLFARHHGGSFLLRIEDTDKERSKVEYEYEIKETLEWLGMNWDEEPIHQSKRYQVYRESAEKLIRAGKAFRCFCTVGGNLDDRSEGQKQGMMSGCTADCKSLDSESVQARMESGESPVIRFCCPAGTTSFRDAVFGEIKVENEEIGDFIILRSDGSPVYHWAVVVDDSDMRITHVIRGVDHLKNTIKHILLYNALGISPPIHAHLPMILGPDKKKLSKRHSQLPAHDGKRILHLVEDYKEEGYLPEALVNFLALLGWSPGTDDEILSRGALIGDFDLDRVNKKDAIFDPEKLAWMNGSYIRTMSDEALVEACLPFLRRAGLIKSGDETGMSIARSVLPLVQERMKTLSESVDQTEYFFRTYPRIEEKAKRKHLTRKDAADKLRRLSAAWSNLDVFTLETTEGALRELAEQMQLSPGKLIHPARVALTGRMKGPGLFDIVVVLGKDIVIDRLAKAAEIAEMNGESSNGRTCGSGP